MKKNKRHIVYTWILLMCFAAGQWAVYTHKHKTSFSITKTSDHRAGVAEKCQLCDAMHHNSMTKDGYSYFTPIVSTDHVYQQGSYDFVSIALILSSGRAPPVS